MDTNEINSIFTFKGKNITITTTSEIRPVEAYKELTDEDHLLLIQDDSHFEINIEKNEKTAAEADQWGLFVRLSAGLINETIIGENKASIAHEIAHTGGLPDLNLEPNNYIKDGNHNLMMQSKPLSDTGYSRNGATIIEPIQWAEILSLYYKHKLNTPITYRTIPLRGFMNRFPFVYFNKKVGIDYSKRK